MKNTAQNSKANLMRKKFDVLKKTRAFSNFIEQLMSKQDERCAYCKKILYILVDRECGDPSIRIDHFMEKHYLYHIDHIVPISKGGTNARSNLCISCESCNLRKSNKLPISRNK